MKALLYPHWEWELFPLRSRTVRSGTYQGLFVNRFALLATPIRWQFQHGGSELLGRGVLRLRVWVRRPVLGRISRAEKEYQQAVACPSCRTLERNTP